MNTLQKDILELDNQLRELGFFKIQVGGKYFYSNSNRDINIYTFFGIIDYVEYWNFDLKCYCSIHDIYSIDSLTNLLRRIDNLIDRNI